MGGAIEGTGGYGAGPAHHLEDGYGYVMTFDNQLAHFGKTNAQVNDLGIRPWN